MKENAPQFEADFLRRRCQNQRAPQEGKAFLRPALAKQKCTVGKIGTPGVASNAGFVVPSLTMQAFGFDMAGQTLLAKLRGWFGGKR